MADIKFIPVGEHKFILPEMPKRKDILFSSEKKADQYWRRLEVPDLVWKFRKGLTLEYADKTRMSKNDDYADTLSYEDTVKLLQFREDDIIRRWTGVWFMNNGEPVYLTGGQYFQLQWGSMPGYTNPYTDLAYGEYREAQRDVHYMLQLCKDDKHSAGAYIGKAKKSGITNLISIDLVDESTKYKEQIFKMMSKSKDDARDTNFMYYLHCFDAMPDMFKPPVANRTQTELAFGASQVKNTGTKAAAKKLAEMEKEGFDSHVSVAPTKANAFDGPKVFRGICDELPKCEDPYPEDIHKKTKETVKVGYRINGKLWYFAYTPEDDGTSFMQARDIYHKSALSTKRGTDRTISTLYKYFMSAENSFEEDEYTFDRYGRNDRQRTRKIIMDMRKLVEHDPAELQSLKRQYPLEEHEMWEIGGGGKAAFNTVRLGLQMSKIKQGIDTGQLPYEMGRFEWVERNKRLGRGYGEVDGVGVYGLVEWVPLTPDQIAAGQTAPFLWNGKAQMDHTSFNNCVKNSMKDRKGSYKPSEMPKYCGGVDPTEYVEKSMVKEGSKDCIIIGSLPDPGLNNAIGKNVSDRPFLRYHYRHDSPDDFLEDLVKVVLFFSCPIYLEGNKKWVTTQMRKLKLQNFLAVRSKEKTIEMYDEVKMMNKDQSTLDTIRAGSVDVINDLVIVLKQYLKEPDIPDDYDNMNSLWDVGLIDQLMMFDPKNTTSSDMVMAFGFYELLKQAIIGRLIQNSRKNPAQRDMLNVFKALVGKDFPESKVTPWGAK